MSSEDDNESEDNESEESETPVKIREDGGVVVKLDRRDCGNLQYFNDPDFSDFALEAVDVTSRRTWHLHRVLLAGARALVCSTRFRPMHAHSTQVLGTAVWVKLALMKQ